MLAEELRDRALERGHAVDGDEQRDARATLRDADERFAERLGGVGGVGLVLGEERHHARPAATQPREELAVVHDDARAGHALRRAGGRRIATFAGPGEERTPRIRRIGGADDQRACVLVVGTLRAEALLGAGERELRGAALGDEVAAAHASLILERAVHVVDVREAAGQALRLRGLAEHDAVALHHRARDGGGALGTGGHALPARSAQRPATFAAGRSAIGRTRQRTTAPLAADSERAEWLQRVVGDLAGPHEIPERREELRGIRLHAALDLGEEERAALLEELAERRVERGARRGVGGRRVAREQRLAIGAIERDAPVVRADRLDAGPHHLAGREELIEHVRAIAGHACGQHLGLEHRRGDGTALELRDGTEERLDGRRRESLRARVVGRDDALPVAEEAREHVGAHRLDGLAEARERLPLEDAQYLGIAVFERRTRAASARARGCRRRQERARHHLARGDQVIERSDDRRLAEPPARRDVAGGEGAMRPRIPGDQRRERILGGAEERLRQPALEDDAQRIAIARDVLHREVALFTCDAYADDASIADQRLDPSRHRLLVDGRTRRPAVGGRRGVGTTADLVAREITEPQQQIVQRIGVAQRPIEALELPTVLEHDVGVEELSELGLAEQLTELRVIDGQCLRAALGGGRVLVVDEVADEREEQ